MFVLSGRTNCIPFDSHITQYCQCNELPIGVDQFSVGGGFLDWRRRNAAETTRRRAEELVDVAVVDWIAAG